MADPFLAEIRVFSFVFAPQGWALCNGQLLPINQNQALFALLGTTYGGNGQTNFALPDLRARVPIHRGAGFTQGQRAGAESHTLTIAELPAHSHAVTASADGNGSNSTAPANNYFGATADNSQLYYTGPADAGMSPLIVSNTGGGQAHENRQPFLTLSFCIALQGIFPSQN